MAMTQSIIFLAAALACATLGLQGCGSGASSITTVTTTMVSSTIPDIASKNKDLSTLVTALKTAGLVETLSGAGPFTVFAPTNAAFDQLPKGELSYLLGNTTALTQVLEYHVASGRALSSDLSNGEKVKTLEGSSVSVALNNAVMINDATVTTPDVMATNGVVHVIDKVLIPPGFYIPATTTTTTMASSTITDIASKTKDLSTLVTALKTAGLVETLSGTGPFTVFAPTNAAFDQLPRGELSYLLGNTTALTQVLEYHVASGRALSSDLSNGEKVKTLEGSSVSVTLNNAVRINDATVTTPDVMAANGVVHVIDTVLIPPGFYIPATTTTTTMASSTITDIASKTKDLSTLVTALKTAGLVETLSGAGPFTVFAPTNDAFNNLPAGVLAALLKPANLQSLKQVLTYHVASGEVLSSSLTDGEQIKTLEGSDVNATVSGSSVMINSATVLKADVLAVNGVVHVISTVLLPPSFIPPALDTLVIQI